jgi:hypothetical protein
MVGPFCLGGTMRRSALQLVGVLIVVVAAGAILAKASAESQNTPLALEVWGEGKGTLASTPSAGGVYNYWGELKDGAVGSYRAICTRIPAASDKRMSCTVILMFGPLPSGGHMVAQGLVDFPQEKEGLFRSKSERPLLITGVSGVTGRSGTKYPGTRGVATIAGKGRITIRMSP